jgi:hypothetical protein
MKFLVSNKNLLNVNSASRVLDEKVEIKENKSGNKTSSCTCNFTYIRKKRSYTLIDGKNCAKNNSKYKSVFG